MSTNTPDPPSSFTDETLNLWRQYPELNGRSRQRPSPEKLAFILEVLRGIYIGDATSCNKSHVRSRYRLNNNDTLQYIPEDGRPPRTVINDDEAYGLIVESHLKYGHAGREKVFHYLKDKFYHITREEVGWVLRQCAKCKARCKGGEAPYENSPDMAGADADEDPAMDGTAAEEEENYLPGAYTKKFNALRAESKLDESEWMNLCLCVARDVRGPAGLDVMLENEDKAKAWEEHFSPLCDVYAERHWGTKMKGRWWAGDRAGDRVLIKDFLRRLFMNFFQKERIHRARIARKASKGKKSNGSSTGPGGGGPSGGPSGGTTWMRTHPPIKIPAAQHTTIDQDHSPCAQKGLPKKRQREIDPASLHYTSAHQGDGEPSQKHPRLERIMVLLTNAEREQDEAPPDTSTHIRTRKRNTAGAIRPHGPVSLEPTPDAVFRLDPIGAVFPPALPPHIPPLAAPTAPTATIPSSSNKPIPAPAPTTTTTPQIPAELLFMTYVQRDERRHEIRLIRGETLTPLPFTEVLEKLRKKHRLAPRQVITAVVLDFKGSKLCIEPEDEDCQLDWETWVRVEGPGASQVEVEVKVAEVVG